MTCPTLIEGPYLRLRPVASDDAAYIHALRTDPRYNAHLSPVGRGGACKVLNFEILFFRSTP